MTDIRKKEDSKRYSTLTVIKPLCHDAFIKLAKCRVRYITLSLTLRT